MVNHMPFCTSCGEEMTAGTKFCESCGAPADQMPVTTVPETPVMVPRPPLVPPPPPKKPMTFPIIIGIVVVLAVIAAGVFFVGLPYLQKNTSAAKTIPVPSTMPVTSTQAPVLAENTPAPLATPTTPARKLEGRFEQYYEEVYTHNQFFAFGQKETFPYDLTTPPLYIKYNLTPHLITREKVINIGLSSERTINVTYPNPNAWFAIKVLDANNGAVIDEEGYGKDYPDVPKGEFMVRNPGNYRIEFSGNDVTAEISVLKGTT
jgi:hypothetical protein